MRWATSSSGVISGEVTTSATRVPAVRVSNWARGSGSSPLPPMPTGEALTTRSKPASDG
ncbi:hypothetical protein D3C80_1797160 [compost metagenome]